MRRLAVGLLLCCFTMQSHAKAEPLKGFYYASVQTPEGNEWESPGNLALNKEQPHAYFFSFQDKESARKVLPENSAYWQSLNGDWKFNWVPNPEERSKDFYQTEFDVSGWDNIPVPSNWNIYGIQKDGTQKYGTPIYVNQPVIFQHKVAVDDWRGGVMRTPPAYWTTFKARNEVGSYRREFTVPEDWDGKEVFIHFDGVDSFFYLWINGRYVGFSKNSRNTASFNITDYLVKGTNIVAAEVYRSSDGSFLEAQDMFRLPGIYRTVALTAVPRLHVRDLVATPDLDETYTDGELRIHADIRNLGKKAAKGYSMIYSLYANKLYSDENTPVAGVTAYAPVAVVEAGEEQGTEVVMKVKKPDQWSAELPYRYTLVGELKDKKGRVVETVSTIVGFREVEIKDTPASEDEFGLAGRYYYVNGKTVKLKGVNRHESNPGLGHAITRKMMEDEIMLMKRANINHVRNSHYPDDPYWYYLCNKYGIYLEDEANIESHQYYYGKASLSHPVEWRDAHVARVLEMVHANINNPSIVIWSLGNEAGPGKNFVEAYDALKKVDTSRPVQYERNNDIVDMGSNQYPSISWVRGAVKGTYDIKYPFHISEYAHSMGNACGNLVDYWEAMESTNFFCGGAIWDWVDQSMYNYTKDGVRYLAYGGDFGDTPNDGQFVMNGIVFGDLEPKPQYYEVKKVYQHIGVKAIDTEKGVYEIFNKYYFKDLSGFAMKWALYENGKEVESGLLNSGKIAPRTRMQVSVPYNYAKLKADAEYFVKVQFLLKEDRPWAQKNYVMAEEQLPVKAATGFKPMNEVAAEAGGITVEKQADPRFLTLKGGNFTVRFDNEEGTIYSLNYGGETIIADGNGPRLDAFRAFTNNDNWFYQTWFEAGLHNLKHRATVSKLIERKDGSVVLFYTVESQAPNAAKILGGTSSGKNSIQELTDRKFGEDDFKFTTNQVWTVYRDGSIELQASITSNRPSLVLPRLGYVMKMPQRYGNFTYYGRGPVENYADRKVGQFIELYESTVAAQFANFPKPQDMGNHEDVRWCALTDKAGKGAQFIATSRLSVSALQYSAHDLILAGHPYQLPEAGDTYLHLDLAVTGLGGNSCGQGGPLVPDRVFAGQNHTGFIIRPAAQDLTAAAQVAAAGDIPLSVTRTRAGMVELSSIDKHAAILYTVGKSKAAIPYTEPIDLRGGGVVTAWFKENPAIKSTVTFPKIETIQTEVVYASSEEVYGGSAKNLVDNDPNTIWHSMYSVTVAKYPHWVDLDAGDVKNITGFTYLPRQDSNNGNIKDYTIHVSMDGKNWGEPVQKGTFANNRDAKKVIFNRVVKGRYIRFTALSEQSGQDFASGAELSILAE
ncbi:glycoside hydrolase family 2 TIM barrel-domain containing protein [uncultured Phocaeicola sp.]|uniref:glycoside hydrolase family 2 TIM barrel-domain containing protein n=1 Tax=uncultured Phocaeicola sp. TaxID=990718 RepID=UPI001433E567|nr:glycoside hydrolase family 2 TIM barrel-domain containing protein [uncultured Phocaeicola sp.]GFH97949.1 evolved beta-galactosidase subunit alpha [Bacteroidaceae bacterium]